MTRGLAVIAIAEMGDAASLDIVEKMKEDSSEISLYANGELVKKTIAQLSDEAAKKLAD